MWLSPLAVNLTQTESPEKKVSIKELPRSDWPVSVSVLGAGSVFIVNWHRRSQPTQHNAVPGAGGSGCIRKLGKHQLARVPASCFSCGFYFKLLLEFPP